MDNSQENEKMIHSSKEDADELMEETTMFKKEREAAMIRPSSEQIGQKPPVNRPQAPQSVNRPPVQKPPLKPSTAPGQKTTSQVSGMRAPSAGKPTVPYGGQKPAAPVTPAGVTAQKPSSYAQAQRPAAGTQMPRSAQKPASQTPGAPSSPAGARTTVTAPIRQTPASPAARPARKPDGDVLMIDEEATHTAELAAKRAKKYDSKDSASSFVMSIVKAVVYIVCVVAIAIPLAVFIINTANDVFKFVVEERTVEVEIPESATTDQIADILEEKGLIKYKWAFKLWCKMKHQEEDYLPGTYSLSTTGNYDYLRSSFRKKNTRDEIRITIPEGYTVDELIDLFVSSGIGTKEGFIKAINETDYDFAFMPKKESLSPDRYYRLEGYLFPDTYNFYTDATEKQVIYKLLSNFNTKFIEAYYGRCEELGMSVDDVIILASMVEKEARFADDLGNVSSVFHNRLKYDILPYLASDATIVYAIQHDTGVREAKLDHEGTEYDSAYNTYQHKGLPPGAICNPGINAIKYALYPNSTYYFYFVSDSRGDIYYAATKEEHEQNIIKAREN